MGEEEVQALVHDVDLMTGRATVVTKDGRKLTFNLPDVQLIGLSPKELVKGKTVALRHGLRSGVMSVSNWGK